jgi:organic radical activating enzyme
VKKTLPLAPQAVYETINGEAAHAGLPQVFIRLAGCSVGCKLCDTNYTVAERATVKDIVKRAVNLASPATMYAWITGGEPFDHDLGDLIAALHQAGFLVAVATAGTREVPWPRKSRDEVQDWLSVSPHDMKAWVQRRGDELKIVPGLNGLKLSDVEREPLEWVLPDSSEGARVFFAHYFVQPCDGLPETVQECIDWVKKWPRFRLTLQMHKMIGLP